MKRLLAAALAFALIPPAAAQAQAEDGGGFIYGPAAPQSSAAVAPQITQARSRQEPRTGDYVGGLYIINRDYLLSYPNNVWRIVTGPARYDRDDWLRVALVLGGTGAFLALDDPIRDFWQGDVRSDLTDDLADGFATISDTTPVLLQTASLYVVGEVFNSKRESAAALLSFESRILTAGLIAGLKYITGRERPANTDTAFDFNGPALGDFNASFPSGHAGDAFALAAVIDDIYTPEYPWVPFVAYPVATAVGLARINDNRHWASDIFLGGALGLFVGKMVTRFDPFLRDSGLSVRPLTRGTYRGASLAMKF